MRSRTLVPSSIRSALLTAAPLALVLGAVAARAELPRVVVVLDETVDGKKAATTSAEVALTTSLNKDGYRVISGEMADKLRKAQAVSMALSGSIPDVLSSLDADVVILGQVETTKIGSIAEAGLVGYRAAAIAKLVRIDTAQIAEGFSVEGSGRDFTDAGGAQKAARAAGEELAKAVKLAVSTLAKKPKTIDLVIHGLPDRAQVDNLKAALAKERGVQSVTVRQSGKGISKIELTTSSDTEAFASQLDKAGLPIEVVQTAAASILARYDVKRGVKLGAVVLPPTVKLAARGKWAEGVLPELVEAELINLAYFDVVESGGDVALAIEALPAGKDGVALTVTARDVGSKDKLFVASGTGELADLPALVSQVMRKLDDGFLPAVARGKGKRANTALARAAAAGRDKSAPAKLPVAELKIEALQIESLFPAKLGHYQDSPVGKIALAHGDPKGAPAVDVSVSVYVPRFMQLKSEVVVGTLEAGERREVPLKVTLDNATLFATEENTPTQAEVVVEYTVAGGKLQNRRVVPLVVYGRRAIDWSENTPIAAFVTPQEETARTFARGAVVANDGSLPEPVLQAIAMFQAMGQAQLKYVKDPVLPARSGALDTVQFARETLQTRAGDCDDLSVLFATLLESVGVETAFLLVPGHVLVGVNAGVPPDALDRVTLDPARVVVKDGKAFVPVETTMVGKPFREAWAQGAATVARVAGKAGADGLTVVETRRGWASYPPAALPRTAGLAVPKPDAKAAGAVEEARLVAAARDAAKTEQETRLAAAVAKDPAGAEAGSYATLLARQGKLDAARAVLKAALDKKPGSVVLTNNLANVDVLGGDVASAVGRYRGILEQAGPRKGDVLTNLGIAYSQAGDAQKAVEAFDAALAEGASSAYLATGFDRNPDVKAAVAVEVPKTRAADEAKLTVAEAELKAVLAKALEQRKKKAQGEKKPPSVEADRFANPLPSGARRGDDPQSRLRTAELLRWM
ncbi:MAG: hypothetical protein HYS27_01280 [Deltaproteobacteria bacterium]|nr:hypothetical protein [Deltaproteobacteria bacterium]